MALTRIDSATEIIVSVDGSARISDAETLASEFRKLLEPGALDVTLSLTGVVQVDVSFFQLLLALDTSLSAQGRLLGIRALPADHIVMETSVLLGIGLERFIPSEESSDEFRG
jgi:anti-anti-sigma regulatory factor